MTPRKRSTVLSERQKKILEVLDAFQAEFGYPPSIREIGKRANISSTSVVNYYLEQLKELGLIDREDRVSRGTRLKKPNQAPVETIRIPILGRIFASKPVLVPGSDFQYYDSESMIDVAASLMPLPPKSSKSLFALEVQGDSMIDAMVNEGDIVIMLPTTDAHNGEMVAVWLEDKEETTLKYFYRENGRIRLQPANPTMQPIYVDNPASVRIQGKVIMVIRQVGGLPS
jgi:repressor LexA